MFLAGTIVMYRTPRFMTDKELRAHFGLTERALYRLRHTGRFPAKDNLIGKTDSRAVDRYFDQCEGIVSEALAPDGPESFG
jgi:hypothetical protein